MLAAALELLSREVAAEYYSGGETWSATWIARIRHSWRSLGPRVTAARMVADYDAKLYRPAIEEARGP